MTEYLYNKESQIADGHHLEEIEDDSYILDLHEATELSFLFIKSMMIIKKHHHRLKIITNDYVLNVLTFAGCLSYFKDNL